METANSHTRHTVSVVGSSTGAGPASRERAASDAGGGEPECRGG